MTEFVDFVTSVGFPIAACYGLYYMINGILKRVVDALNNNTVAMNRLIDKLDNKGE